MALSFLVIWHKPNTKLVIQSYLFFSTPPISPTIFPHNKHTKLPFTPKSPTPQKKIKPQASEMLHYAKHHASENRRAIERSGSVDKCWGHWNKKHKKQPFGEKPNPVGTWYFTSAHNCNILLNINHLARTRSIASLPCKIIFEIDTTSYQEIILTIRGFSPWNGERFLSLGQSG